MSTARRRRIAVLGVKYLPSRGGVSRVVEDLILRLKDRYDFTVYCFAHPNAQPRMDGVEVVQYPEPGLGSLGVFVFYLRCYFDLLVRRRPDLVHVHKTDAAPLLPLIDRRFTCVATSHEAPYRRDKWSWLGRLYFRVAERAFVGSHAALTCISLPLTEYYRERFDRDVTYLPNGVPNELESDREGAARVLERHGIRGEFLLFAARRIMATKGCHTFLEALARLGHRGPVVVVGDFDQVPSYTRRLKALARGLDVYFVGFLSDKAVLMGLVERAGLFVFPSENEGMSVMLLEVARVGTPIVCSRIPENTAVFDDDEVAYFRAGDADDLAGTLTWARENVEAMRERGRRARRKVVKAYSSAAVADRYAELYEEILDGAARGRTEPVT